jgi:hypothetical protein
MRDIITWKIANLLGGKGAPIILYWKQDFCVIKSVACHDN